MVLASNSMNSLNLFNLIFSGLMVLTNLILTMIIAFGYYYEIDLAKAQVFDYFCDNIYQDSEYCQDNFPIRNLESISETSNIILPQLPEVINISLEERRKLQEPTSDDYIRGYLEEFDDNENRLKKGKKLNKAGFSLVLIDVIVRITELFVLVFGNERKGKLIVSLVFISFLLLISYMICLGISFDKFKKIYKFFKKVLIAKFPELETDEVDTFYKEVRRTKKLLIGIIVLYCLTLPLLLFTLAVAFCCGGLNIKREGEEGIRDEDVKN